MAKEAILTEFIVAPLSYREECGLFGWPLRLRVDNGLSTTVKITVTTFEPDKFLLCDDLDKTG